ncbi:MAG TPA: hypothetical protein VM689_01280 [Aliidongia sp.]|nr:hypothetical protein [Aliidongia sp.]
MSPFPGTRLLLPGLAALVFGLALALGLAAPAFAASSTTVEGVYALDGIKQQVAGTLIATEAGSSTDLKLDVSFRRTAEKNPLKRYDSELSKEMHIIAVSDDLSTMLHHHVGHVIDGHGQDRIRFPAPGLYHIYVDAAPKTIGQQVLRFDLAVGGEAAAPMTSRPLGAPETEVTQGLYTLAFDRLDLPAGQPAMLELSITEHGKPARDLHPYLGVPAHAVLVGAESLDYIHIHPMAQNEMHEPPMAGMQGMMTGHEHETAVVESEPSHLRFHLQVPKPGAYRLWLQFIGGRTLYTVPFVLVAK